MDDHQKNDDPGETTDDLELSKLRNFVKLLELRMLEGHTEASNRTWATLDLGVPLETFEKIQATVLKSWKLAGTTQEVTSQRRDQIRQQYQYVYKMAVEKEKIKDALHALDSMVKLDGLDHTPEDSLKLTLTGGAITNTARENIGNLMNKMRELAMKGVPRPIALPPVDEEASNGHSNGHTNGHGPTIIDLRSKKD